MANLTNDDNRDEMLETVLEIARRGPGAADDESATALKDVVRKVFVMQDVDTFADVLVNELSRNSGKQPVFFWRDYKYATALYAKLDLTTGRNTKLAERVTEALLKYSTDSQDIKSVFRFFYWSCKSHISPGSDAGNAISSRFLEEFFAPLQFESRISSQIYSGSYYVSALNYYKAIAKYLPDTPGLSELIERDIQHVKTSADRHRRGGQSDSDSINEISKLLDVIKRLPDSKRPKQQLVDLVNDDFQFFTDTKDNPHLHGNWRGAFALTIVRHLGLYRESFLNEKDFMKAIGKGDMKIDLVDGKMKLNAKVLQSKD